MAAVLLYNQATGQRYNGQRNIEQLKTPETPSMSVNFDTCFFENNAPSYGVFTSISGNAFFNRVVFQDNARSRVGCIGATQGSRLGVSGACFLGNSGFLDGIVLVDSASNITRNVANFGENNDVRIGGCEAVFHGEEDGCIDFGECTGECLEFTAQSCGSVLNVTRGVPETPPPAQIPIPNIPGFPAPHLVGGGNQEEISPEGSGSNIVLYISLGVVAIVLLFVIGSVMSSRNEKKKKEKEAEEAKKKKKKKKGKKSKKEEKQPWWKFGRGKKGKKNIKKEKSGINYADGDNDYDDVSETEDDAHRTKEEKKKKKEKSAEEKAAPKEEKIDDGRGDDAENGDEGEEG